MLSFSTSQFIETLFKTQLLYYSDHTDFLLSQLHDLPNKTEVSKIIFSIMSKQQGEEKETALLIYIKYINNNHSIFDELDQTEIFDIFQKLVTETSKNYNFDFYNLLIEVLLLIISKLTKYSPSSIYSSIISWNKSISPLALVSCSIIHQNYIGNTISKLIESLDPSELLISALNGFFSRLKYANLDKNTQEHFERKKMISNLQNFIEKYIDKYQIPMIKLIGSIIGFLDVNKSIDFCDNIKSILKKDLEGDDVNVRIAIATAISKLPTSDDHSTFNSFEQFKFFFPLFFRTAEDAGGLIFKNSHEFLALRIKNDQIKNWIKTNFEQSRPLLGTLMISSKYDIFSLDEIFQSFSKEANQNISDAIVYIAAHKSHLLIQNDLLISKSTKLILECFQKFGENSVEKFTQAFLKFTEACKSNWRQYIISVIESHDPYSSNYIIKAVTSGLNMILTLNPNVIIPKIDKNVLVRKFAQNLVKFVSSPDDIKKDIVTILKIMQCSFQEKTLESNQRKTIMLYEVCDYFVPNEIADDVQAEVLSRYDEGYEQSIVALALNSSIPVNDKIATKAESLNPFNMDRFLAFYEVSCYKNPNAISRFSNKIADINKPPGYFSKYIYKQQVLITNDMINKILLRMTEVMMKIEPPHAQQLLSLFEKYYEESENSELFLRILFEKCHSSKLSISNDLEQKILKSEFFVKCLPNFVKVIDRTEENMASALNNMIESVSKDEKIIEFAEKFAESSFKVEQKADFNKFIEIFMERDLMNPNILSFLSIVCIYSENIEFEKFIDLFLILLKLTMNKTEKIRKYSVKSLSNIFKIPEKDELNFKLETGIYSDLIRVFYNEINQKLSKEKIKDITSKITASDPNIAYILWIYSNILTKGIEYAQENKSIFAYILSSDKNNMMYYSEKILDVILKGDDESIKFCLEKLIECNSSDMSYKFAKCHANFKIISEFSKLFVKRFGENNFEETKKRCIYSFVLAFVDSNVEYSTRFYVLWLVIFLSISFVKFGEQIFLFSFDFDLIDKVFALFGVNTKTFTKNEILNRDLFECLCEYYAKYIEKLRIDDLSCFFDPVSELFKFDDKFKVDRNFMPFFRSSTVLILSNIYMITHKPIYAAKFGELCFDAKDSTCRFLSKHFSDQFDINELNKLQKYPMSAIFHVINRSLINRSSSVNERANLLTFYCKIIPCMEPSEICKILDTDVHISRHLDFICEASSFADRIGYDIILDAIYSIYTAMNDISLFLTMCNEISICKIFILSVNKNEIVRTKAIQLLCKFSNVEDEDKILQGLSTKLEPMELDNIACAFIRWAEIHPVNFRVLHLIKKFVEALKGSTNANVNKVAYKLLLDLLNKNDKNQQDIIRIMTILLSNQQIT